MTTHIHVYAETRLKGEWKADTASTFIMDDPNRFGWVNTRMEGLPCPADYRFFGLLVDEIRHSWSWSFVERELPADASPEVRALSNSWGVDGYGHSHLSQQELVDKLSELVIDPRPEARELQQMLCMLLNAMAERNPHHAAPDDRRIVLWFDN